MPIALIVVLGLGAPACRRPTEGAAMQDNPPGEATQGTPPAHDDGDLLHRDGGRSVALAVGARPAALAAGDLDGDGDVDLVVSIASGNRITARLQRGGAWVTAPDSSFGENTQAHLIALADVDRDGRLDLVTTSHDSGSVALGLGDGSGRFVSAPGSPFIAITAARPHNHGLATGDVDGDGDPDVVVADQGAGAAAVLLSDGKGGLSRAPGSPISLGGHPYPPALGDLDGDGRLDLVAPLVDDQAIAVLLGDGRGGFTHAPGSPRATGPVRPYAVALADLDGDGRVDVIASHDDTDQVSVLLGDGRGGLRDAPGSPVSLGRRIWRMVILDVDRDGTLDLVGAGSGSLVIVPGDGHGGLGRPRLEPLGEGWQVIAADLDDDGLPDLAAPDSDSGVLRLWLSRPAP